MGEAPLLVGKHLCGKGVRMMAYNPEKPPDQKREKYPQEDKRAAVERKLGEQAVKGAKK